MLNWVQERCSERCKPHLEFEGLHFIGAGSEVCVDKCTATERAIVVDIFESHAVSMTVATV